MTHAIQHLHKRKRIYKNLEKYPNPSKFKRVIDWMVYAAGIATPILTFPQLLEIWIRKNAEGVSLLTWGSYLMISIIFSFYGIIHKEKPIIIMYVSLTIIEIFIILGIILYS